MEKILSISDGIVGLVQFGFGLSAHIFRFGGLVSVDERFAADPDTWCL